MEKEKIKAIIMELMRDNDENFDCIETGYDRGYAEGCHDAYVDVLKKLGIETDEKYYN